MTLAQVSLIYQPLITNFNSQPMANITILHVSDIHYDKNEPEAQGLILSAFFDDIKVRLDASNRENTFCIISGDLVNKGNSDKVYEEFYENFIVPLSKVVPLKSIYCTPGNHDLNRNVVEENIVEHTELIEKRFEEIKFNEYINTDDNIFLRKFKPYEKFCKEKLYLPNFNLLGYCESPISELSIYFLNCSLFCSGGFKKIEDKGKLKIETSRLNKWIQDSKGRTRVLVMHHPLDYLTSFARKELKSMLLMILIY
jgi:predicted MPP superfamily phosphohydrolase